MREPKVVSETWAPVKVAGAADIQDSGRHRWDSRGSESAAMVLGCKGAKLLLSFQAQPRSGWR